MRRITCYIPFNGYNVYSKNIQKIISEQGYEVLSLREIIKKPLLLAKCKVYNFNWFEDADNIIVFYLKSIFLSILKMTNKRIIFTLHNKHSHENGGNKYNYKLMKKLCEISDVVIGLCNETYSIVEDIYKPAINKVVIIPHPNYIKNYEGMEYKNLRKKYSFSEADLVFLFLGVISEYKNVEMLIRIFNKIQNKRIKLVIAGNPTNVEYGNKITKMITNSGIICDFRHIPEDEIPSLYNMCNVVILPYMKSSYLNSGAVLLSCSLGKTIICPEIGTVKDITDKSLIYSYDYENEDAHELELQRIVHEVCEEFLVDSSAVVQKGKAAKNYVEVNNSLEVVALGYKKIYEGLFSV